MWSNMESLYAALLQMNLSFGGLFDVPIERGVEVAEALD